MSALAVSPQAKVQGYDLVRALWIHDQGAYDRKEWAPAGHPRHDSNGVSVIGTLFDKVGTMVEDAYRPS